jgi:hypothetical protein
VVHPEHQEYGFPNKLVAAQQCESERGVRQIKLIGTIVRQKSRRTLILGDCIYIYISIHVEEVCSTK